MACKAVYSLLEIRSGLRPGACISKTGNQEGVPTTLALTPLPGRTTPKFEPDRFLFNFSVFARRSEFAADQVAASPGSWAGFRVEVLGFWGGFWGEAR